MTSFMIQLLIGCFVISTIYYFIKDVRNEKKQREIKQ